VSARLLAVALACALLLGLAACGRKGGPLPPGPPDQVTYPRTYPAY
jgi:predicted small lipoprotein YifL